MSVQYCSHVRSTLLIAVDEGETTVWERGKRESVYSRLAGYEEVNDAQRLSQDPTFLLIGSEKIWEPGPALTSRLQSFETEVLARGENQKTKPVSGTAKRAALAT